MKKDEAKKALEQLNIPEQKTKRSTRVEHDYAALSATTFRNKKEVVEPISTPKTPVATIKKAESCGTSSHNKESLQKASQKLKKLLKI